MEDFILRFIARLLLITFIVTVGMVSYHGVLQGKCKSIAFDMGYVNYRVSGKTCYVATGMGNIIHKQEIGHE